MENIAWRYGYDEHLQYISYIKEHLSPKATVFIKWCAELMYELKPVFSQLHDARWKYCVLAAFSVYTLGMIIDDRQKIPVANF